MKNKKVHLMIPHGMACCNKNKMLLFLKCRCNELNFDFLQTGQKRAKLRQPPINLFFRKLPVNLYVKIRPVQGQVMAEVISTCHTFCYNSQQKIFGSATF